MFHLNRNKAYLSRFYVDFNVPFLYNKNENKKTEQIETKFKESIMKKLFAVLFSIFIIVLAFSLIASAENGIHFQGSKTISVSESGYARTNFSPRIAPVSENGGKTDSLPAKYDARKENIITPVKDQGYWGTCWSFSAISCAETSLIKKYPDTYSKSNIDLSEIQHAYFSYNDAPDKLNMTGDRNIALKKDWLDIGGNVFVSSTTFAKGFGVAYENSITAYEDVNPSTKINNKMAYSENIATLQNAYWVSGTDISGIKKLVMKTGSVSAPCYHDWAYINEDNNSLYYGGDEWPNHIVTIVGWDDNFSRYKFGTYAQSSPKKDGAWLVKNSHGKYDCDNGYFWLSYYDAGLSIDTAAAYDFRPVQEDENKYQYDGSAAFGSFWEMDKIYGANIFRSNGIEALKEIAFFNDDNYSTYKYQIYLNPKGSNPSSGTPVYSTYKTTDVKYCGYNTIKLDNEIQLSEGTRFAVVIASVLKGGVATISSEANDYLYGDESAKSSTVTLKGQSFTSANGKTWSDVTDKGGHNLRIKAITRDGRAVPKSISADDIVVERGGKASINAAIKPSYASKALSYTSSDTTVATVSSSGVVTGKGFGICTVTIASKASKDIKTVIRVKVVPPAPTDFEETAASEIAVNISWEGNSIANAYRIYIESKGEPRLLGEIEKTTAKIKSLKPGKTYKVYVCSVKYYADEEYLSDLVPLYITTKPSAPTVKLSKTSSTTAKLSWNAVTGAQKYVIYKYNASKGAFAKVKSITSTSIKITNIKKGSKYAIRAVIRLNGVNYFGARSNIVKIG